MKKGFTIQKFFAFVAMGALLLAITPQQFLHDCVAHHSDTHSSQEKGLGDQWKNARYHCDCDHVLALPLFTETAILVFNPVLPATGKITTNLPAQILVATETIHPLRGPPANGFTFLS